MEKCKASVPALALLTATANELQESQLEQLWLYMFAKATQVSEPVHHCAIGNLRYFSTFTYL